VLLVRDLLDQALRDPDGEAAGRIDDFLITAEGKDAFVEAILSGGGVLADDLGLIGRACEVAAHIVRRRPLRRATIPWSLVSEVVEHAVTIAADQPATSHAGPLADSRSGLRLRAVRRLPMRSQDGVRMHVVDVRVTEPTPLERPRVVGLVVCRRRRVAWPASLRPRQRGAPPGWRFLSAADVRFTRTALVVEQAYHDLPTARGVVASPPPARIPRATR
jgi:hypothetical protein